MKMTAMKAEYIKPVTEFVVLPANDILTDEGAAGVSVNTGTDGTVDNENDDELAKPFDFSNEWETDWSHEWETEE